MYSSTSVTCHINSTHKWTFTHHSNGFSVQYEVSVVDWSSFDVVGDPPLTYTCTAQHSKPGWSLHTPFRGWSGRGRGEEYVSDIIT